MRRKMNFAKRSMNFRNYFIAVDFCSGIPIAFLQYNWTDICSC